MLIVGVTLIVVGLLAMYGPLASEFGGTDSPPSDERASDPPGADADDETDEADGGDTNGNGDEASGNEEDEAGSDGIRGTIGGLVAGEEDPARTAGDERPEECFVDG